MAGTQFYNCDFHVHSPASLDYKDKSATPDLIVQAALENGLNAIAITDHNSHEGISEIRKVAEATGLVVFPGFEVTAQGGHIVAIFDPDAELEKLDDALTSCGITKDKRGKEDAIGKTFKEILKIIVNDFQGIAIAAHADGPKGFLKTIDQGQLNIAIYKDENLLAMELVNLDELSKYVNGKDPNYDRKMPCIQCSDAHKVQDIGSRSTLIKMHHLSVDGIRQAFNEPDLNISFPSLWEIPTYPFIKSISVDRGFLAGQVIEFNPSFNCLLGGAGSGKSTVIEFLRFVFDQVSENPEIRDDCYGKLADLAGVGATIRVRIISESGEEYLVARTYNQNDDPIVVRTERDTKNLSDVDIKTIFPVHAYSQGEALIISRNHSAQLDLIDKHIPIDSYQHELEQAYSDLEVQIGGLIRLEEKISERSTIKKELASYNTKITELNNQLEKIKTAQDSPVVKSHQFWIEEKNYLVKLVESFEKTKKSISASFNQMEFPALTIPFPESETPNKDLLIMCQSLAKELTAISKSTQETLNKAVTEVEDKIREEARSWKIGFEKHQEDYDVQTKEKGEEKLKILSAELELLKNKAFEAKSKLNNIDRAQEQFNRLLKQRNEYIEVIKDRRTRIATLRKKKVKEIIKTVERIRISLTPDGYRETYQEFLTTCLKGSHIRAPIIEAIAKTIHPLSFTKLLREENVAKIQELADIPHDLAKKVVDQFKANVEHIYRIESVPIEDLLEISFEVEDGVFRPLGKLSTGQKATVIVSLSLIEGTSPIIFDQPEDALYSPFIFSNIVKLVRESKLKRQFIFATHNPNIAVGSGLDLGIVLDGSSTETSVRVSGGIDDRETKELVILHLEGGEDAIRKRLKAYRF